MGSRLSRVQKFVFPSGFTLLHEFDAASPVAAYHLWIRVGSAHETEGEFGVSHFLEHMLFKGTDRLDAVALNNAIENFGGNMNAFTSFEETAYHMVVSSRFWRESLEILLDMTFRSVMDGEDVEVERDVILEELREGEDALDSFLSERFFAALYPGHPYGRPVIGTAESLKKLTREGLVSFYRRWYTPTNMVLAVAGNVEWPRLLDVVRNEVGDADPSPHRPAPVGEVSAPKDPAFYSLSKGKEERILEIAFPIPGIRDEDIPVVDVLSFVLGEGDMSRLHQALQVEKKLVGALEASTFTPNRTGQILIRLFPHEGETLPALRETIAELRRLTEHGVTSAELQRAKLLVDKETLFNDETTEGRARTLAYYQMTFGDVEEEKRYREKVYAVTQGRLLEVARKYLNPARAGVAVLAPAGETISTHADVEGVLEAPVAAGKAHIKKSEETVDVHRFRLSNGAHVVLRHSPFVKIAGLFAAVLGGLRSESEKTSGVSNLLAAVLDRGTELRDLEEIDEEATALQADIMASAGRNTVALRVDVPNEHFLDSLDLAGDLLSRPLFEKAEVEVERAAILRGLAARSDYFPLEASNLFYATMFPGHPYAMDLSGKPESVRKLGRPELKEHFRLMFHPENLVIGAVAAVGPEEFREELERSFPKAKWRRKSAKWNERADPSPALTEVRKPINGEKAYLWYGFPGVAIAAPDRYPLEVLAAALASSGGGRLYVRLREELGLVYSVEVSLFQGLDAGFVAVSLNTTADRIDQTYDEVRSELQRVVSDGLTKDELVRVKNFVIGSHEIELQRAGSQAAMFCLGDLYGTGRNFYDFSNRIAKVTLSEVAEAAEKYLTLDRGALVILSPHVH